MARDYLYRYLSPSPTPPRKRRSTVTITTHSLTELESSRLSSINSRTTCITFHSMKFLPPLKDLLRICPSYPAQSVVVGPNQQLWCFLVFPTALDKEMVERELDCASYKGGYVIVDRRRQLVPIAQSELECSRELSCLAVHGISAGTSKGELERTFPEVERVTIARRGGSAFLGFREKEEAERAFKWAEGALVGGVSVVVLFGHSRERLKRGRVVEDLRGRLDLKRREKSTSGDWPRHVLKMERVSDHYRDWRYLEMKRERSRSWSGQIRNRSWSTRCCGGSSSSRWSRKGIERKLLTDYKSKRSPTSIGKRERKNIYDDRKKFNNNDKSPVKMVTSSPYSKLPSSPVYKIESSTPVSSPTRFSHPDSSIKSPDEQSRKKLSCSSDVFNSLYRVLVSQLVEVGLAGKLAHGRAADIVNLWADTGYNVDQLVEVTAKYRENGRDKQREVLCRIVRDKCKKKAKKLNIDIGAMVDITIAYIESIDTEEVSNYDPVDICEFKELAQYLKEELTSLGMKKARVKVEVDIVLQTLAQMKMTLWQMEAEYITIVGNSHTGGLAEFHTSLEKKMAGVGFCSMYLSARLAAGLVMEFYQGKENLEKVVEHNREIFENMDSIIGELSDLISKANSIPKRILSTPLGYPRMVVVVAWRLFQICSMSVKECKVLARAMVGAWVTYGFDYIELGEMYEKEKQGVGEDSHNLSLMDMRRLLHCRLRDKVDIGFAKPRSFGFSKLIDLSIFYFENSY